MIIKTIKLAKRVIILVVGFTVLIIGIILIPTPVVPGLPVVIAGLAILAIEFVWARKLLNRFKEKGSHLRDIIFRRKKQNMPPVPPSDSPKAP